MAFTYTIKATGADVSVANLTITTIATELIALDLSTTQEGAQLMSEFLQGNLEVLKDGLSFANDKEILEAFISKRSGLVNDLDLLEEDLQAKRNVKKLALSDPSEITEARRYVTRKNKGAIYTEVETVKLKLDYDNSLITQEDLKTYEKYVFKPQLLIDKGHFITALGEVGNSITDATTAGETQSVIDKLTAYQTAINNFVNELY